MLKVTVEVWPYGEECMCEEIGTMVIVNDGGHLAEKFHDYDVTIDGKETIRIEGFERDLGFWRLIRDALEKWSA